MKANRSVCRSFVVIIQPQRWSCRKHVSIINRNGSHAESTLSLFDLNVGFTTNMLPISDRKVCGLYIPFSGSASNNCRHCIVGSESGQKQTSTPFALSERKAKYPNKDQNTPAQENDRIFRVYRKNGQRNPNNHRPRGAIFFFGQLFISPKTVLPSSCDT